MVADNKVLIKAAAEIYFWNVYKLVFIS